jgi:hypothetical protein
MVMENRQMATPLDEQHKAILSVKQSHVLKELYRWRRLKAEEGDHVHLITSTVSHAKASGDALRGTLV